MIELLGVEDFTVTSGVETSSSRSKKEKAEKVTRKYKYGEVQGNKLSNLWLQLGNAQRALGNVIKPFYASVNAIVGSFQCPCHCKFKSSCAQGGQRCKRVI